MKLVVACLLTIGLLVPLVSSAPCSDLKTQGQCSSVQRCTWAGSCKCKDTEADFVFLVDESGSVQQEGFDVQKDFLVGVLDKVIPAGSGVGVAKFGSGVKEITSLTPKQPIATVRANLQAMKWDRGATNMGDAIRKGLDMLKQSTKPNKIIFLATDGKPNGGTISEPCDLKTEIANTPGLHVIIVGVSSGFDENKVTCLVQKEPNPSEWIIKVLKYDPALLNAILPDLDGRFCPQGFQLKITEIKPEFTTDTVFFEMINQGANPAPLNQIFVTGMFQGNLALPADQRAIGPNQVAVVYNGPTQPKCTKCLCEKSGLLCVNATYVECKDLCSYTGAAIGMTVNNFFVQVADDTSTPALTVNLVQYDTNPLVGWPKATKGYSYELKDWNLANTEGINWQQSCDLTGTPGDLPITNCTGTCFPDRCQSGGDINANCTGGTNICTCTGQYYLENGVCITLLPPKSCTATLVKIGNNSYNVKFDWTPVPQPPSAKYEGVYIRDGGTSSKFTEITSTKLIADQQESLFLSNLGGSYGAVNTLFEIDKGSAGISQYKSVSTACLTQTSAPTPSPTPQATNLLTFFAGDICGQDRCDCRDKSVTCVGTGARTKILNLGSGNFIRLGRLPLDYAGDVQIQWTVVNLQTNTPLVALPTGSGGGRRLLSGNDLPVNHGENTSLIVSPPWNTTIIPGGSGGSMTFELTMARVDQAAYGIQIVACVAVSGSCTPVYPKSIRVALTGKGGSNQVAVAPTKTPVWLWFLIAALVLLLVLASFLAYRWWIRNKVTSAELDTTKKDLDVAIEENELGFGHDLGGDIEFNPMATGVPGQAVVSDPYGSEMQNRRDNAGGDRADVAIEKFGYRQQMGQVQQGGYSGV